ncbi:MAG: carbohydrate-binding protein, partial [Moraxellaceae bacterium]
FALSAFTQTPASSFNSQYGVQLENATEEGQNVAFIDANDYVSFNNVDFASGAAFFQARIASNNAGGAIEARLDSLTGAVVATCPVTNTGGWQNWKTVSCVVKGVSGSHTLFLKFTGGAGNLFNILWFSFAAPASTPAFNQIEAEKYSSQSGVQTEVSTEAGGNVGWIDNGDYLAFQNVDFQSTAQSFSARVSSAGVGGNIEIRVDSLNGALAGTCKVPVTGGWQTWTNTDCAVSPIEGVHTLYLKFTGSTGALFNINWFKFSNTLVQPSTGDIVGKISVGYQAWFNAKGDGSPFGCWFHWSNNCDAPTPNNNVKFEVYPDTREYSKLYQSNLANLANGSPARLFSSFDQETLNKHFEWMQAYNIDTAALQRFGASEVDTPDGYRDNRDIVASKVRNAAESFGRKFYVMYDITGLGKNWVAAVKHDWTATAVNKLQLTSSSAYARQNGKLVVCIWGIGFTHTQGTPTETAELIAWFKNQNIYVIGGVPTYWRTGQANSDAKPGFIDTFKTLDMISPWLVGRFSGIDGADNFKNNLWAADFTFTQQNKIAYQPVIWPGFAWSNMYPQNPRNQIPRLHGDFMWRQAFNMKQLGVNTGYVAMFDEYDEGTAIAKAAENATMAPTNQYFQTLDADGVAVSSDFYLRLTRDIGRMFKDEINVTEQHPTGHF